MKIQQEIVKATERWLYSVKHLVNISHFCRELRFLQEVAAWEISTLTGETKETID